MVASFVALVLVVSACAQATSTGSVGGDEPHTEIPSDCRSQSGGVGWQESESVFLKKIDSDGGYEVYAAEYPFPGPTEGLWSQWGQGVVLPDGRHFSAVGDHLGVDGNSHLFVYEPESKILTRFMDVLSVVDRPDGSWGFGKIHAQMVVDRCQRIWAATYWGTRSGIREYEGDHMILIDPRLGTVVDQGIVSEGRGVPSMNVTDNGSLLVVEAVDPASDTGRLVSWDTEGLANDSHLEEPDHLGFRALAVDVQGRVIFSAGSAQLATWDVEANIARPLTDDLPGDWMRAVTNPGPDGTLYAVTQDPPALFALRSSGAVEVLGDPGGYTTSLGYDEAGGRVFWMANAHGGAWKSGAAVMTLDTETGQISEVLRLRDAFESELGLLPGGTYSMVYSEGTVVIGVNASDIGDDSGFGTVVLVVVEGL
jgi:hypothetical protein